MGDGVAARSGPEPTSTESDEAGPGMDPLTASHAGCPEPDGVVRPLLQTYLAGIGEMADPAALATLRAGAWVRLHATHDGTGGRCSRVEVCTADGRPLGRLPAEDVLALPAWLKGTAVAQVTAMVPSPRRWPRIQLAVAANNPNRARRAG
jgi:hypothetical protein